MADAFEAISRSDHDPLDGTVSDAEMLLSYAYLGELPWSTYSASISRDGARERSSG
jgi:hypothetical protein